MSPFLNFELSIFPTWLSILMVSSSFDISRLKNATGMFCLIAIFSAILSIIAVFPAPGLPAIITRFPSFIPKNTLSRAAKPVLMPFNCFVEAISWICSKTGTTHSPTFTNPLFALLSDTPRILFSASSSASFALPSLTSYIPDAMSLEAPRRSLKSAFSATI